MARLLLTIADSLLCNFLRKWSLDELPGLINMLHGEKLDWPKNQLASYLNLCNE